MIKLKIRVILCMMCLLPCMLYAQDIDVGFSPGAKSGLNLVLQVINSARISICMATYSFTSQPVANALINAHKRGVLIKIVSDTRANASHYSVTQELSRLGIPVALNNHYAIMHNKFIVVDNMTVETGSFNYSQAAVMKNAENVLVIWNNPVVAHQYNQECQRLFNQADKLTIR